MNAAERIDAIIEWRERRGTNCTSTTLHDLAELRALWRKRNVELESCADYFPIRIVTLLEVFVRDWVAILVNHGSPYVESAEKLCKDMKFGFVFSLAMQNKKISLGELVAHSISLNKLSQIFHVFETLVGDEFKSSIKSVSDRFAVEIIGLPDTPIIEDFAKTARTLERLLAIRHIVVHEHPQTSPYAHSEINLFLDSSIEFVSAVEEELSFRLHGKTPLTQVEMNIEATTRADTIDAELKQNVEMLAARSVFPLELLRETQAAWVAFRDLAARLRSSSAEGGSMQPMIYAIEKEELTKIWLERLRRLLADEGGG